ncbi:MAG: PhoH family protein [Acidobacteria bacterium]|nr:PhoH family protein [Acidobacteriota bacterium]
MIHELDPVATLAPILQSLDAKLKVYVLDTNVLLHDPTSLFRFQENVVVIPLHVIDEIDAKKGDPVIGFNAREVSQKLEQVLSKGGYSTGKGARIPNGNDGVLLFLWGHGDASFPKELELSYFDNFLLASLMRVKKDLGNRQVILVTKDRNLRIKSQALGIPSQDYLHDKVTEDSLTGTEDPLRTVTLTAKELDELFAGKKPAEWHVGNFNRVKLRFNEGVLLADEAANHVGLGYRRGDALQFIHYETVRVLGVGPRVLDSQRYKNNFEQAVCMAQAMDDHVKIHVMVGKAGTGKTHIAMAAALEHVFLRKKYDSIKLIKPIITHSRLGEDIGFLPGTVKKKLLPRMRPFVEKLQKLVGADFLTSEAGYQKLLDDGVIEMMNLADVRGADLSGSVVVFDEAQNANPFQMRTLGTRLGEDSKLMVLGDPTQIDNIYLDKYSNALVHLYQHARRFPEPFIASISLTQMVRSYTSKWFEEHIVSTQKKRQGN